MMVQQYSESQFWWFYCRLRSIVLSSLFLLSVIEGLLESWIPYSPYQLLYKTTEDLSFDDKKIKMLSKEIKTLKKKLASQKKSSELKLKEVQTNLSKTSEQKIEKVQTDYMKNIILSVTLKNDVLKYESNFQGTYQISEMVNGKPRTGGWSRGVPSL